MMLSFLKSPLLSVFIGIAGIAASVWTYQLGKSAAVAEAVKAGKAEGRAEGLKEANAAFEKIKPELVKKECEVEIARERKVGYAEGREVGRKEGREAGRKDGVAEGRAAAEREFSQQRHAEKNWQAYADVVRKAAELATILEKSPENTPIKKFFLSQARAVVSEAQALRQEFAEQARAFNSTVDELAKALETGDDPKMRSSARTLATRLKGQEERFLQANRRIVTAFDNLREKASPRVQ